MLLQHYPTAVGDAGYDARYDLNSDGRIDLYDLVWDCRNFGAHRGVAGVVIGAARLASAQPDTTLTLVPSKTAVHPGETFEVEVHLNGTGIAGVQAALGLAPQKLSEVGWVDDSFLASGAAQLLKMSAPSTQPTQSTLVGLLRNPLSAVGGAGTVMRFTVRVAADAAAGPLEILPLQVKVVGANAQALYVATSGASIQVLGKNTVGSWMLYE